MLIQNDSQLTQSELVLRLLSTQLKFVTLQNQPNCHKQTASYVYVHSFSAMFSPE